MTGKTINRYIARRTLRSIMIAFIIITSIIMLVDFVELTRNIDKSKGGTFTVWLGLTVLNGPKLIEETIPFVVLFGVMGALYGMNRRSELIVLRAAGLSAWKFLRPALFVSAMIGVFWTLAFNPMATYTSVAYDQLITKISGIAPADEAQLKNVWLREGDQETQTVIHALSADTTTYTLNDVTFYIFQYDNTDTLSFSHRYDAKTAKLTPNQYWVMTDVTENRFDLGESQSQTLSIPTTLDPESLNDVSSAPLIPSFWNIPAAITKTRQSGFSTRPLTMKLNTLLALPLSLMAMTLIAAAASMRLTRAGGTLQLLIFGGVLGFTVFFVTNIMQAFGETGALPTVLAAWSVPVLVFVFALTYLSRLEDG